MCMYCREEEKLSVCIKTTPSCIHKKKSKLWFCIWTRMTWPQISKSFFFPSKIYLTTLERQLNYLKCFATMWFEHNSLSPEFPGAMSSLVLLVAPCLFREYLKCIQLKRCVKSASHYFYCFNGFKSMTIVMCQMGMLSDSILFIRVATPVLAPTMLDVPSWR